MTIGKKIYFILLSILTRYGISTTTTPTVQYFAKPKSMADSTNKCVPFAERVPGSLQVCYPDLFIGVQVLPASSDTQDPTQPIYNCCRADNSAPL